ncbi:aminotransferase [Fodinicurvata sp. EGI_FJ10296]|uniref:aminotransferase n=1 Tax=Fodinicurvata sp. EGI_FJ10296 TaxID=3231908 RepID=UPI003455B927
MKQGNAVLSGLGTTVFESMSRLAAEHRAVNLGQGFPDDKGPEDMLRIAADAVVDGWNQYPSMMGVPELRQAVARHENRFYGLDVDWQREVMVTSGATEALAGALLALIEPGDEVILFQPMYDAYAPLVRRAGGVPRYVTLTPPDWRLDIAAVKAAVGPATKAILFNNPLNPAARVFGEPELRDLADLVVVNDLFAICDEVYEHIVFDGRRHIPLITLPGMRERTIKIGSAGKTFSLTGWKVGYITAAPELLSILAKAHQYLTFTTPPGLQTAVAHGLEKDDGYFDGLAQEMQRRRDRLTEGLRRTGFTVLPCEGTYFVNIDLSDAASVDDVTYCRRMTEEAGVTSIPVSAFCPENPVTTVARFCFAKQDRVLDEAVDRLARWRDSMG